MAAFSLTIASAAPGNASAWLTGRKSRHYALYEQKVYAGSPGQHPFSLPHHAFLPFTQGIGQGPRIASTALSRRPGQREPGGVRGDRHRGEGKTREATSRWGTGYPPLGCPR
ncbi:MAG: hypothetical protein MZU91_14285 [Desulfosudis oleivorans]|nr:hypothetical protein [Desulfosudis oleivorans]